MILRKSFSPAFLVILLCFGTVISAIPKANAEDDDAGISVGRLQFGKSDNDKWLKVDIRKTPRTSFSNRVNPAARQSNFTTQMITNYRTTYAAPATYGMPAQPAVYPPASTMVSNHRLLQAASIAVNNAHGHSTGSCWRYVKSALLKAEAIDSYPKTGYAKQAASELVQNYGFVRTTISNPFSAPIGSVLVYGGSGAGHIEIRTRTGFVSDFVSAKPSNRPLIGVFVKL